jgi:CubicO group peptidase (beta-lactamase class C family)
VDRSWRRGAAFALFALLGAGSAQTQARLSSPGEIEQRVEMLFERWNRSDSPGCALGVGRQGETLLARAWGMADLEHEVRNTPETIFEAGSVTKQFTAAAVLLLAREGRLSLADPVRKYFPELPDYGVRLTVEHMLHHTSGLRDWGSVAGIAGWPRWTRVHTHAHVLDIVSRQKALNFEPGSEHSYCNTGYNLAAMLVGRRSEQSFVEFTAKRIFEPLEMRSTSWRDDHTRIVKGRAIAYSAQGDEYATEMPFENVHGNGGLLTTVGDLLKWNRNFVTATVGGAELVQQQLTKGRLDNGREIAYARGVYVTSYRGVPEVSHSGSTAGYRAFLARYPDQDLSIALLCNAANANATRLAHQVAELYLGLPTQPPQGGITIDPRALASFAGLYRQLKTGEAASIVWDQGVLRYEGGPQLTPIAKTRFRLPNGSLVDFEVGSDGRPRRLIVTTLEGEVEEGEPVARDRPTTERLRDLAGSYWSEEAEVSFTIAVDRGELKLKRRPASVFTLKPLYADAWEAPFGMVRFRRDAAQRVVGLSVSVPRVRDMRFERTQ